MVGLGSKEGCSLCTQSGRECGVLLIGTDDYAAVSKAYCRSNIEVAVFGVSVVRGLYGSLHKFAVVSRQFVQLLMLYRYVKFYLVHIQVYNLKGLFFVISAHILVSSHVGLLVSAASVSVCLCGRFRIGLVYGSRLLAQVKFVILLSPSIFTKCF